MKKTLLAGASMAVLLTAANDLAAEYTGVSVLLTPAKFPSPAKILSEIL